MSEYPILDGLVDGVRERSDTAFASLYRHTSSVLASYAFSMLRDRKAAEDAVQQAFLELVKNADQFNGDGRSLRAWLFRSVRFTCLDEIRRRSRRPETPSSHIPEREDEAASEPDVGIDPALEQALSQLTERQRSLVVLRHVIGLSGSEAAAAMGMTRPAAYTATQRAERRLRSLLQTIESDAAPASLQMKRAGDHT